MNASDYVDDVSSIFIAIPNVSAGISCTMKHFARRDLTNAGKR